MLMERMGGRTYGVDWGWICQRDWDDPTNKSSGQIKCVPHKRGDKSGTRTRAGKRKKNQEVREREKERERNREKEGKKERKNANSKTQK